MRLLPDQQDDSKKLFGYYDIDEGRKFITSRGVRCFNEDAATRFANRNNGTSDRTVVAWIAHIAEEVRKGSIETETEREEVEVSNVVESNINVAGVIVKQDQEGRYCLNDLHRASGGEPKNRPNEWLRNSQTEGLVRELETGFPVTKPVEVIKGRGITGTYVVKELVYAYAMWISASFHLKVIRAYDQMVTQPAKPAAPELTGKQHKNVIRDIRGMLEELGEDGSDLSHENRRGDSLNSLSTYFIDAD